jgi:hypothetical protein
MNLNKVILALGAATLIGAATPAQASWLCLFTCGGGSSSSSSGGGSSTGGATPVPEPEQMGLFAMGIAIVGVRMFRARAKRK